MPAFWNRIRAFCWREPNCRLMGVDPHFFGGSLVVQNLHASIIFRKKKLKTARWNLFHTFSFAALQSRR